ncbi:UNKNOWN [Stylonychia lemnae]|uniref:t-SNARE coiled-coil homology domain-containing protein n=1 Tax=Stylonychia lemnae TaxID=5949 RepID=A0A078A8B5_STYLE|nr:UNKNOWN [Stylonychia lemnae]|eukprot:CDW77021.1 UNKNOWN [Stylonychia lemnae]
MVGNGKDLLKIQNKPSEQQQLKNKLQLDKIGVVIEQNSKQFTSHNEGLNESISVMVKQSLDLAFKNINSNMRQMKNEIIGLDQQAGELDTKIDGLESKVDGIDVQVKGLDSKVNGLDTKVIKIQDDMEFIKLSLTQILQKYNQ